MERPVVTPSMFYQYAACPHWLWYDRYGDQSKKGEMPELAQKLLEQGVAHEQDYLKGLDVQPVLTVDPERAAAQTLELMKQGATLIYQGVIEVEVDGVLWRGRPDLLEKKPGKSSFGDWMYAPCDIKSSHSIHDTQALQLAFYALTLERLQGVRPLTVSIINVDKERIPLALESRLLTKCRKLVRTVVEITGGKKPPLSLRSKCKHSPWFAECKRAAQEANDIALLYGADPRALETLREEGIRLVPDAAKMNVSRLPKIPFAPPATLDRLKLQAQSLVEDKIIWRAKPALPDAPLKIYFDIEGDPLLDLEYLFGFWITGDAERKYAKIGQVRDHGAEGYFLYFLAEQPEDQDRMWKDFLDWTELLPKDGFVVYHFADYERSRTLRLAQELEDRPSFRHFAAQYVDLFDVVKASVVFPLYFYSIKDIAKSRFLKYKWRHEKAGGAQSVFWYEKWLETKDRKIMDDIVDYNEDDVIATEYLCRWLREESQKDQEPKKK